jgi:hypothetical protein
VHYYGPGRKIKAKLPMLKADCKRLGLRVTGTKAELVARLVPRVTAQRARLVQTTQEQLEHCADFGSSLTNALLDDKFMSKGGQVGVYCRCLYETNEEIDLPGREQHIKQTQMMAFQPINDLLPATLASIVIEYAVFPVKAQDLLLRGGDAALAAIGLACGLQVNVVPILNLGDRHHHSFKQLVLDEIPTLAYARNHLSQPVLFDDYLEVQRRYSVPQLASQLPEAGEKLGFVNGLDRRGRDGWENRKCA